MSDVEIGAEAQAIVARLAAVDVARPVVDRPRVEAALTAHLSALAQPTRPIRWADDAAGGYRMAGAAAWAAAGDAARDAAGAAAGAAAWAAAGDPAIQNWRRIMWPFVTAYEAGLWLYWVMPTELLIVPRPALRVVGQQLHAEDGPAVAWPTGERYWFLHGVRVDEALVMTPAEHLDPARLLTERNVEVRREMVRKIGIERICTALGVRVLARGQDHAGQPCELLALDLGDGRRRPYLKLRNPSVPGVYHLEGVPPTVTTVAGALRWRNQTATRPSQLT